MSRSVCVDLPELEPGTYSVLMKITANRSPSKPTPEQIIKENVKDRPEKLIQVGLAYDLAHAKAINRESEAEKQRREALEAKKKAVQKQKQRAAFREEKLKQWQLGKKQKAREKRHQKRKEEHLRKRAEKENWVPGSAAGSAAEGEKTESPEGPAADPEVNGEEQATADAGAKGDEVAPEAVNEDKVSGAAATIPSPPAEEPPNGPGGDEVPQIKVTEVEVNGGETADLSEENVNAVPSLAVNISANAPSTAPPPSIAAADDWMYDSDASFDSSIDSELDFPAEAAEEKTDTPAADEDDEDAEFVNDPWNAVCIVGLRVYSKDDGCTIGVIKPRSEDEDEIPLDVDDASKGPSGAAAAEGEASKEINGDAN